MTANRILLLSLLPGALLVFALFGPYISIGPYPILVCCILNFAGLIAVRRVEISETGPVSSSLKSFVKFFYITIASSVVPLGMFLYWAAERWLALFAVFAVLFCGIVCSRIIDLVERRERSK